MTAGEGAEAPLAQSNGVDSGGLPEKRLKSGTGWEWQSEMKKEENEWKNFQPDALKSYENTYKI